MTDSSPSGLPLHRTGNFWFVTTTAAAFCCIALLAIWSANDASFPMTLWKGKVALRLQSIPCRDPETANALGILDAMRAIRWDSLGKRVLVLYAISGIGIASTVTLAFLALRQFTVKRIVICGLLFVGWGLLYATHSRVDDWRVRRQVAAIFSQFEQAGSALEDKWPVESGFIPPGIKFVVAPEKYPDLLGVVGDRDPYPFHEDFGLIITRGQNGIIRFSLSGAVDASVEYHPEGTFPAKHTAGFPYPSPPVASVFPLKDKWYLVRYGER